MNAHVTDAKLDLLVRRALPEHELAATLRHIGDCANCARLAGAAFEPQIDALHQQFTAADETPHIDPDTELAQYVDGTLGPVEREIVETHLDDCAMCRAEVEDLRALARPASRRWGLPLLAAAAAAAAIIVTILLLQRRAEVTPPGTIGPAPPIVTTTTVEPARETTPARSYANAEWDRLVREALRSGQLPMANLASLSATPDVLRGPQEHPAAELTPAGIVVESARPQFSWPAHPQATYVLTIFDRDDNEIVQSATSQEPRWTPSAPLQRGRTYVWQVAVTSGNSTSILPAPPAPPATFRIASLRDHDELAAAQRLHPNDHLLHAVLAARAGLRAEAIDSLRRANVDVKLP